QQVFVLERHDRTGTETSSRNSQVIHAGLYYPQNSLRAELCVKGKALLYGFCEENGIAHQRCGKLLVATSDEEITKLEAIAANAARNGVDDLQRLSADEARKLEPEVVCVAAYLSPSTGVIDSHGLMTALEGHLTTRSGQVVLETTVTGLSQPGNGADHFVIETLSAGETSTLTAKNLVLAAGLGGTELGHMLSYAPGYTVPETYPARGHYYALTGAAPFKHLVYPMPQGAWLGVHLTLDVAGRAKFGPDIEWTDHVSYDFDEANGARRTKFEREIRRYWPALPNGSLQPDYVGVRPKIYKQGEQVADFALHGPKTHGIPRLVALYGIESPGLTASLAIADHVAGLIV
ncbi:MAG: NAD(P)/FAD-dependent oxidoreductase, partial [Hyphomicrobiaceae bacterium]|nr:NAD(P)/FAD-dependent oxidoreductase [Hyphomicrobiaceae bacterium]